MQEYKHSVKVPRNYKLASNILKKALTEGASVKSLVFGDKLKHFRTNVLYALISEAIKHNSEIDELFENTEILKNESRLDPWLAKILTVELLFGKKCLPGQSKPELTVASYKDQFEKYSAENPDHIKKKGARKPRYVRINTNLLTTSDAIRAFQDEECRLVRCTSGPYADYLRQVSTLEPNAFMQDYHVKTVFVFAPGTRLHDHPLYEEHKIILQDKATAMAVHLLAPPLGAVVMDMCAAPGMKTTQLAAYIKNEGTVYAVEQNEERYRTLCNFVEKTGSTCVTTVNRDVLDIKRGEFPDVEYILLDPSCSGSGMDLCAHSYIDESRLARLTSLQEKFLKHAMHAFPKAKRIVYSTCSLFPQENERVVTNVVTQCRAKWNVLDVKELLKEQWNNFGSGMYGSIGTRCMYARPDTDLTTGFFLAVIEKDPKYLKDPENPSVEGTSSEHKVKAKRILNAGGMDECQGAGQTDQKADFGNREKETEFQQMLEKKHTKKSKKDKHVKNKISKEACDGSEDKTVHVEEITPSNAENETHKNSMKRKKVCYGSVDKKVNVEEIAPSNADNGAQKKDKKRKEVCDGSEDKTVNVEESAPSNAENGAHKNSKKRKNVCNGSVDKTVNIEEIAHSNADNGAQKKDKKRKKVCDGSEDKTVNVEEIAPGNAENAAKRKIKKRNKQDLRTEELDVFNIENNQSKYQDETPAEKVTNDGENYIEENAKKIKKKNKKNSYVDSEASDKLVDELVKDVPKKKTNKKKDPQLDN